MQQRVSGVDELNGRVRGAEERAQEAETRAAEAEGQSQKYPAGVGEAAVNISYRKGESPSTNASGASNWCVRVEVSTHSRSMAKMTDGENGSEYFAVGLVESLAIKTTKGKARRTNAKAEASSARAKERARIKVKAQVIARKARKDLMKWMDMITEHKHQSSLDYTDTRWQNTDNWEDSESAD